MATKHGVVKKTDLAEFGTVRRSGLIAIKLKGEDELKWVHFSTGDDEILLATAQGQAIRFSEKNIRSMGRGAAGVRGVRLKKGDRVISMNVIPKSQSKKLQLLVLSELGQGKRTDLTFYKIQGRGGSGIKTMKVTAKTGPIVNAHIIDDSQEQDLVVISTKGQTLRTPLKSISTMGRATQGVRIMRLETGDKVGSSSLV